MSPACARDAAPHEGGRHGTAVHVHAPWGVKRGKGCRWAALLLASSAVIMVVRLSGTPRAASLRQREATLPSERLNTTCRTANRIDLPEPAPPTTASARTSCRFLVDHMAQVVAVADSAGGVCRAGSWDAGSGCCAREASGEGATGPSEAYPPPSHDGKVEGAAGGPWVAACSTDWGSNCVASHAALNDALSAPSGGSRPRHPPAVGAKPLADDDGSWCCDALSTCVFCCLQPSLREMARRGFTTRVDADRRRGGGPYEALAVAVNASSDQSTTTLWFQYCKTRCHASGGALYHQNRFQSSHHHCFGIGASSYWWGQASLG